MKIRLLVLVSASALLIGGFFLFFPTQEVEAQLSPLRRGYFEGNLGPTNQDTGVVLSSGLMTPRAGGWPSSSTARSTVMNSANHAFTLTNKTQFINFIEARFIGGGSDRIGAAFIIQNMRGVASPSGQANYPTAAEIQDWKDRINQSSVTLEIVEYPGGDINSSYMFPMSETTTTYTTCSVAPGLNTDFTCTPAPPSWCTSSSPRPGSPYTLGYDRWQSAWNCTITYSDGRDVMFFRSRIPNLLPALVFRQNGDIKARIKINCGNMLGTVGLEDEPNNWRYGLNITNPGSSVQPGQNFNISSTLSNSSGFNPGIPSDWHGHRIRPLTATDANNVTWVSASAGGVLNNSPAKSSLWTNFGPVNNGSSITRTGTWRVNAGVPGGTRICFRALASPEFGPEGSVASNGWGGEGVFMRDTCFTVLSLNWNYNPRRGGASTTPGSVFPGTLIRYYGDVENNGNGAGPAYEHWIRPSRNEALVTYSTKSAGGVQVGNNKTWNWPGPGIAGSLANTPDVFVEWRVNNDATPGSVICFNGRVTPVSGTTGGAVSNNGPRFSPESCYTVVRNTYNYVPLTTVSGTIQAGSTITVNGRITNTRTAGTGFNYTERIYANWGDRWLTAGDRTWTNEPGLNALADRSRSTTYTISNDIDHNELICFTTSVNPGTGYATPVTATNGGGTPTHEYCFTVTRNFYDYVPSVIARDISGNALNTGPNTGPNPGEEFSVTGTIINNGTGGTGHPFTQRMWPSFGGSWLTTATDTSWSKSGLPNGLDTSEGLNYTIANNTPHDELICFRNSVNPVSGYATPGNTTVGANETEYAEYCFRVDNRRYAMVAAVSQPTGAPSFVYPGQSAEFNVSVRNTGDVKDRGTDEDYYPNAFPGRASGITCSISASGTVSGPLTASGFIPCTPAPDYNAAASSGTVSVSVPATASVGEQVCLNVAGQTLNGFSNGEERLGSFGDGDCIVVGVAPYFHVKGGDVWAGANFDTEARQPIASCGTANSDAFIRSITGQFGTLWRGSFVEYAAFATGDISGFGSYNTPSNTGLLTFANESSPFGNYIDSPKCIPNYFELLKDGSDSTINSAAVNITAATYADGNQYFIDLSPGNYVRFNANSNGSGSGTLFEERMTFVVNGDIVISANGANTELRYETDYGDSSDLKVPSLVLVASGNIYIDARITRIDAILISQGFSTDGSHGIWTCANSTTPTTAVAENTCNEPLTINGALVANRINFMRTHEGNGLTGGVHDPNSGPAEIINFLPEFYLSEPVFKSNIISEDYFRTILIKDLPPIY